MADAICSWLKPDYLLQIETARSRREHWSEAFREWVERDGNTKLLKPHLLDSQLDYPSAISSIAERLENEFTEPVEYWMDLTSGQAITRFAIYHAICRVVSSDSTELYAIYMDGEAEKLRILQIDPASDSNTDIKAEQAALCYDPPIERFLNLEGYQLHGKEPDVIWPDQYEWKNTEELAFWRSALANTDYSEKTAELSAAKIVFLSIGRMAGSEEIDRICTDLLDSGTRGERIEELVNRLFPTKELSRRVQSELKKWLSSVDEYYRRVISEGKTPKAFSRFMNRLRSIFPRIAKQFKSDLIDDLKAGVLHPPIFYNQLELDNAESIQSCLQSRLKSGQRLFRDSFIDVSNAVNSLEELHSGEISLHRPPSILMEWLVQREIQLALTHLEDCNACRAYGNVEISRRDSRTSEPVSEMDAVVMMKTGRFIAFDAKRTIATAPRKEQIAREANMEESLGLYSKLYFVLPLAGKDLQAIRSIAEDKEEMERFKKGELMLNVPIPKTYIYRLVEHIRRAHRKVEFIGINEIRKTLANF